MSSIGDELLTSTGAKLMSTISSGLLSTAIANTKC